MELMLEIKDMIEENMFLHFMNGVQLWEQCELWW